jgi:AbrB family looped-hinge helix DNA binding protein
MEMTKLSHKGQVVIPHRIREAFGWESGVEFAVETIEGGIALRPLKAFAPTTIKEAFGCLQYQGARKSLKDMEEGIRKGAKERS